jgi:hypothetical protein
MSSHSHRVTFVASLGYYQLRWTVDRYYSGSRLRGYTRVADERGARRFARRWQIPDAFLPEQLRSKTGEGPGGT